MVELLTPEIRDLTTAPRQIPIELDGNVAYEALLTMWVAFNHNEKNTNFDLGSDWLKKVKDNTPSKLAEEIEFLGGPYGYSWLALAGLLATAPHPNDPDHVYEWLETMSPKRLRRWLVGYASHNGDASLIEQVAEGDLSALRQLVDQEKGEQFIEHLEALFEIPSDELPERMASTIKRFRSDVFSEYEEDFGGAINRAAAARNAMPMRDNAKAVIEEVTNGLDYEIPLGVTRVVLVPSVVLRPLSLIDQHRETLLVFYGVADEFIDSDPGAPPSWLVRTYKALSDERRLRILRRLSESETTLDALTEMLGLSKSTVHHHMSILRGAGLVRVHVSNSEAGGKCSTYTLREQSLEDATAFLDTYVRIPTKEAQHE